MKLTRRELLTGSLQIVTVTALTPPVYAMGNVTRSDITNEPSRLDIPAHERRILDLARFAPSGHNTQPWQVRIDGPGKWTLQSVSERWLPAVDPTNREIILSLGAFYETLHQAAHALGYDTEYQVLTSSRMDRDVLGISLRKSTKTSGDTRAITSRRTVKKGYIPKELTSGMVKSLTSQIEGAHFIALNSREDRYLAQATIESNKTQAWREPAQEELADWIRWSNEDARKHRNGLTPAGMEINGFVGWMVRNFYTREKVLTESFRKTTLKMVEKQVEERGGWIVMTGTDSIEGLIETGRRFQRMALRTPGLKLGLHPMSQLLEEKPWIDEVTARIGMSEPVQFVLRTGAVKEYGEPVSLRMPLSQIVQKG